MVSKLNNKAQFTHAESAFFQKSQAGAMPSGRNHSGKKLIKRNEKGVAVFPEIV
jgi:hypothetical protein